MNANMNTNININSNINININVSIFWTLGRLKAAKAIFFKNCYAWGTWGPGAGGTGAPVLGEPLARAMLNDISSGL
jgi:hypothetical protein